LNDNCGAIYASYDWVADRLLGRALIAHDVWASVAPAVASAWASIALAWVSAAFAWASIALTKLVVALCDTRCYFALAWATIASHLCGCFTHRGIVGSFLLYSGSSSDCASTTYTES
jgi:hypothetical protein